MWGYIGSYLISGSRSSRAPRLIKHASLINVAGDLIIENNELPSRAKSQSSVQMLLRLRFLSRAGPPKFPPMLKLGMKQRWKKPKTQAFTFFL